MVHPTGHWSQAADVEPLYSLEDECTKMSGTDLSDVRDWVEKQKERKTERTSIFGPLAASGASLLAVAATFGVLYLALGSESGEEVPVGDKVPIRKETPRAIEPGSYELVTEYLPLDDQSS